MTDTRPDCLLQPAAAVLAVTASSYGLQVPPRVRRWIADPRAACAPRDSRESCDARKAAGLAGPACRAPQGEPAEA